MCIKYKVYDSRCALTLKGISPSSSFILEIALRE